MTFHRRALSILVVGYFFSAAVFSLRAEEIEAVSSRVAADYVRARQPSGAFEPEAYAFGKGGYWSGGVDDPSIGKLKFLDVAHVIAEPLATQNYVPTKDPATTKLLIMVYWGTTMPPAQAGSSVVFQNASSAMNALQSAKNAAPPPKNASQAIQAARGKERGTPEEQAASAAADAAIAALQAENQLRRRLDIQNAKLLGYDSWWESTAHLENTPLDLGRRDLLTELEEDRYFVVLMAYDFQLMWKQKKTKLLWETRFSVSERHHEFDKILPVMAQFAAKYFGQDSHGLQHHDVPIGQVELGQLKSLGTPAEKER